MLTHQTIFRGQLQTWRQIELMADLQANRQGYMPTSVDTQLPSELEGHYVTK